MTATTGMEDWNLDNSDLYLNPNETDLLLNALNSNKPNEGLQNGYNTTLSSNPYLEFDKTDAFNWDLKAMNATPENFTSYPPPGPDSGDRDADGSEDGSDKYSPDHDDGLGDKRRADDSGDEDDGHGKRQETGKKTQKPGRKPLTSEPTTKRKAQNRAAQRAFRERKEKHLKDLEDKVDELQKQSESTNNENALLKKQVDRLQTELTEYRKRLSSAALQTSPFSSSNTLSRNSWDSGNSFNFEFPKFGANLDNNKARSASSGQSYNRTNTTSPSMPNRSNSQATASTSDLTGLFSADVLANAERSNSESLSQNHGSRSNSTSNRQFSPSNTASPASSGFAGFSSSCVTTPEYTADSAPEKSQSGDTTTKGTSQRKSFCEDFNTACGNSQNPMPKNPTAQRAISNDGTAPALTPGGMTTTSTEASLDFGTFDWLSNQNGGNFDPVLFADYREPQENIMNNDSWFFNDAFTMPDLGSPLSQTNSNNTAANQMPKKTFMETIEDTQSGKEPEVVPGEQQFLTCNLLWDRVQKSQKVVSGEADMDDLCTQLKAKAKCSGKGAVISEHDVNAILGPPTSKDQEPNYLNMFK